MKFNAPSKGLYTLVSSVSKVINSKNALTILNDFHLTLSADDSTLTVKASDSDNTLVGRIDVTEVEGSGTFCIDARRMVDMLKELPDQGISFEIDDDTLEVKVTYDNGYYNTVAIRGDEYPVVKTIGTDDSEEMVEFTSSPEQIIGGIESTIFAVSGDESHPQMTGILWDVKTDRIVFVATDTRKLVRYSNSMNEPGVECSFILPLKAATIVKNVFANQENIKITRSARLVKFESADFTFDCTLIKGNFPDYNRVIPANNPYTLTIDRSAFLAAVRRVNSFVDANNGRITFKIAPERILMKAQDSSFNTSGEESVACEFTGSDMVIAFSAPYLIEILNTVPTTDIVVKLADQSRAAVILPSENAENTDLIMLLMPMYIQEF